MKYFLLFVALLMSAKAEAHPHAFIDLRVMLIVNAQGQLTAIREQWVFDQYYTEFALHDFGYMKNSALHQKKLLELAHENIRNLKDFDYFTSFDDKAVKLDTATDIDAGLENKRISMSFTIPLIKPLDLRAQPTVFRIYDPSYYTAMLFMKDGAIGMEGAPAACKADTIRPNPDSVWTNMASSLDRNATAPDDLGRYFAEKVTITCK